ncbi:MAG: hypothetical protein ACFFFC_10330 [Candidatus Thorarchaeota archaeon]
MTRTVRIFEGVQESRIDTHITIHGKGLRISIRELEWITHWFLKLCPTPTTFDPISIKSVLE